MLVNLKRRRPLLLLSVIVLLFLFLYIARRTLPGNGDGAVLGHRLLLQRGAALRERCRRKKLHPTERFQHNFRNLMALEERAVVWCPVYKAATSTYMRNLFNMAVMTESQRQAILQHTQDPVDLALNVSTPMSMAAYGKMLKGPKHAKSFILVRHPFHRLVSAFRDKLERTHSLSLEDDYFYGLYGKRIVARYRDEALSRFGHDFFAEENNFGAPVPVPEHGQSRRVVALPSFWEFARYVIDTAPADMDEHWQPVYKFCSLCIVNYEAVILVENLPLEEPLLKAYLGVEDVTFEAQHANANRPEGADPDLVVQTYFDLLSDDEVQKLYDFYREDFCFFGYSFHFRNRTYGLC